MKLVFIGFGEAAFHFSMELRAVSQIEIGAFDSSAGTGEAGAVIRERANKAGVTLLNSLDEVCQKARFIVCLTSASSALKIAEKILPRLDDGQIYTDNFPLHVAIYQGAPGYVLVVSGKGYQERAYVGDLMVGAAQAVGFNGIVIDGCVRDKTGLQALSIPVYAKGVMPRSPAKKGPGKINSTVVCAGIEVVLVIWYLAIVTA